uniref:Uncharacterized protein n=1 Tax=Rhizophora mucronata TaxID=61149 RepID=A0A2P2NBR2_RHIMU
MSLLTSPFVIDEHISSLSTSIL